MLEAQPLELALEVYDADAAGRPGRGIGLGQDARGYGDRGESRARTAQKLAAGCRGSRSVVLGVVHGPLNITGNKSLQSQIERAVRHWSRL